MSEISEQPKQKAAAFYKSDGFVMLCLYFGALVIHILMTLCTTIFNLTPDEFSVTAVAAYANGMDWSSIVSTGGYYGYFQSIFYIPVFWITDEPYLRYHLMLVVNGILMSFAPVIVYYLSRKTFEVKKLASVLFAVICGLYPCYMLLTKYTWNETMCNLLPWVLILLMFKAMDCESAAKKQVLSALGGLVAVAAYATHGRMLSLLAAAVVLVPVVFFSMKKKRVFCFSGFYAAVVVGFVGDKLMKGYLQRVLWKVGEGKTPTNTIEKMFTRLISTGDSGMSLNDNVSIEKFFDTLVGHFFYFISSTWGFGAICVVAVIAAIFLYYKRRNKPLEYNEDGTVKAGSGPYIDDKTMVLCWFTLLAMGAIFVVSIAFKATSTLFAERMDTVMYGRYTEVLYPVAIFAGMLLIYKGRFSLVQSFAALVFGAVVNLLTEVFVVPVVLGCDRFVSAMIMGLAPLRYGETMKSLYTQESFIKIIATTMAMLFVWVIIKLIRRESKHDYPFFAVPLACLLIYSIVYGYVSYTVPQSKNAQTGANYMTEAIEKLGGEYDSVAFVAVPREKQVKAQFLYPEMEFEVISSYSKLSNMSELPEIILSPREESLSLWKDGIYLVGDLNSNIQLCVTTEEAAQRFREQGLRVTEGGSITYTAVQLPATTSVVKRGHDESADLDYENPSEDSVVAMLPNGSSVYTNYFHLQHSGEYIVTVYGDGVDSGKVVLTQDKGSKEMEYEVVSSGRDKLVVKFTALKKTENVRFKLTCSGSEPIEVSGMVIEQVHSDVTPVEEPDEDETTN